MARVGGQVVRLRWISLVLIVLGVVGLSGCGINHQPPPAGPSVVAPSAPLLPPRPRDVRVDGIDPCTLAYPDMLAQLGVGSDVSRPKFGVATASTACAWSNFPASPRLTLDVSAIVDRPVTNYLRNPGTRITSVAGFPAVDSNYAAHEPDEGCIVRVDVAAGQGIWVTYTSDFGNLPGATHELMCQKAHTAAEAVMRTLLGRTG